MSDYGQEILNEGLNRLEGTWEYNGETYDLLVEDINYEDFTLAQQYAALAQQINGLEDRDSVAEEDVENLASEAEQLDDFSWEDDGNRDFIPSMVDAKLIKPEVDIQNTPVSKLRALVGGMMQAWQEESGVSEAREEMPLEGNR
jgi:hypothetical protein